ncbi:MAG: hypothetical protein ACD_67C00151G0004, partial [uncultured bacterium]
LHGYLRLGEILKISSKRKGKGSGKREFARGGSTETAGFQEVKRLGCSENVKV